MQKLSFYLNPENWKTTANHQYSIRELWYPLVSAIDHWENEFHELMLRDKVRMAAYTKAIEICVEKLLRRSAECSGEVIRVMDLGSGSGIWSHLFASLWEKKSTEQQKKCLKIYSIEISENIYSHLLVPNLRAIYGKSIVNDNCAIFGNESKTSIIFSANVNVLDFLGFIYNQRDFIRSYDKEMVGTCQAGGEQNVFDAIISECIGGIGDDEGILEILYPTVAMWAKKDCIVVPHSITQHFVPITTKISDAYANTIKTIATPYSTDKDGEMKFYDVVIPVEDSLAEVKEGKTFPFAPGHQFPSQYNDVNIDFNIPESSRNKEIIGVKGYFSAVLIVAEGERPVLLELDGDEIGGEHPPSDCWKHTYIPLTSPIQLCDDNHIVNFHLSRFSKIEQNDICYSWSVTIPSNSEDGGVHTEGGEFKIHTKSISEDARVNNVDIENTESGYDVFRNFSFLSDLVLGLAISAIFTLAVYPSKTYVIENGLITSTSLPGFWERAGLLVIAVSMVRIMHSFFVLARDKDFIAIEKIGYDSSNIKNKAILYLSRFLLVFCLSFIPVLYTKPDLLPEIFSTYNISDVRAAILLVGQMLVYFALLIWDYGAKIMIENTTHQFNLEWRQVLRATFRLWFYMDLLFTVIAIGLLAVFTIDSLRGNGGDVISYSLTMLIASSIVVICITLYDYWHNALFYSARIRDTEVRR